MTYHYEIRGQNYDDRTLARVNASGVAFVQVAEIWKEDRPELERLVQLANAALEAEPHRERVGAQVEEAQ